MRSLASILLSICLIAYSCYATEQSFPAIKKLKAVFGDKRPSVFDDFGSVFNYHYNSNNNHDSRNYVACMLYRNAQTNFPILESLQVSFTHLYASSKENTFCIHIKSSKDTLEKINNNKQLQFQFIESLPPMTKIDSSVHHLHHYLTQQQVSPSSIAHPLIAEIHQNIANNKDTSLGIGILFDRSATRDHHVLTVHAWKTLWAQQNVDDYRAACRKLYWHKDDETKYHLRYTAMKKIPNTLKTHIQQQQNPKEQTTNPALDYFDHSLWFAQEQAVITLLETHSETHSEETHPETHSETHSEHSTHSTQSTHSTHSPISMSDYCHLSSLDIKIHRHGMSIHFSDTLLTTHLPHPRSNKPRIAQCLAYLLPHILITDSVMRVGITQPFRTLNNYARGIVQSGTINNELYGNMGLSGTDIIIGLSDTGLDEYHCFFHDRVHGFVPRCSPDHPTSHHEYRKIIQYVNFSGSSGDYSDGHGSHVAGSLAGFCLEPDHTLTNEMNTYKGMAPNAQIAFLDIGIKGNTENLVVPDQFGVELFPPAYSAGARIHSNSWGGGYFFDAYSLETDEYLYAHPDFSAFFAAGNAGASGAHTIVSPGLAKNTITVGCSEVGHTGNTGNQHTSNTGNGNTGNGNTGNGNTGNGNTGNGNTGNGNGNTGNIHGNTGNGNGNTGNGNANTGNGNGNTGNIHGNTGNTGNQHTGNVAFFSSTGPTLDGRMKPDIVAPGYSIISTRAQSELRPAFTCTTETKAGTSMATPVAAGNAALIQQYFANPFFWALLCNEAYRYCRTGAFTPSGRLMKALVVHAGARMTSYNGVGTPRGVVNIANTLPDPYQGYGRTQLSTLLPSIAAIGSLFQLYVDEQTLFSYRARHYYVDITNPVIPLKVTVTWYDPPNEYIASRLLVHDLDLVITSPLGQVYYGNSKVITSSDMTGHAQTSFGHAETYSGHDQTSFGHDKTSSGHNKTSSGHGETSSGHTQTSYQTPSQTRDEVNPTEQLTIQTPLTGRWTISVQAKQLIVAHQLQTYAIVITTNGEITESSEEVYTVDPVLVDHCYSSDSRGSGGGSGGSGEGDTNTTLPVSSTGKVQVEVSLWAKITQHGWTNGEYYTLTGHLSDIPDNRTTPSDTGTASPVEQQHYPFTESTSYKVNDHCLDSSRHTQTSLSTPPASTGNNTGNSPTSDTGSGTGKNTNSVTGSGCYDVTLHLPPSLPGTPTGKIPHHGVQLTIPQCHIHLSALTPSHSFCLTPLNHSSHTVILNDTTSRLLPGSNTGMSSGMSTGSSTNGITGMSTNGITGNTNGITSGLTGITSGITGITTDSTSGMSTNGITGITSGSTTMVPGYPHHWTRNYHNNTSELVCMSAEETRLLQYREWMVLDVLLYEGGGAGWTGGYYAVMAGPLPAPTPAPTPGPTPGPTPPSSNSSANSSASGSSFGSTFGSSFGSTFGSPNLGTHPLSITSNTLIWGYEEVQSITLPYIPKQCYYVQLSYPTTINDYPALVFLDAYDIPSVLLPATHNLTDCPYWLNTSISLASFCLPATPYAYATVTFYGQAGGSGAVGQSWTNMTEYWTSLGQSGQVVGQCFLALSYLSRVSPEDSTYDPNKHPKNTGEDDDQTNPGHLPGHPTSPPIRHGNTTTSLPTYSPTRAPTKVMKSMQPILPPTVSPTGTPVPTTNTPTLAPTHFLYHTGYNFSGCFGDCLHYPDFLRTSPDKLRTSPDKVVQETCLFLLHDVYHTCDSFAVAYGYCDLPTCIPTTYTKNEKSKNENTKNENMKNTKNMVKNAKNTKKSYCTRETWCYYAISSMLICVSGNESTLLDNFVSPSDNRSTSSVTARMYQSCLMSYANVLPSLKELSDGAGDEGDTETNNSNTHTTRLALTVIAVVLAVICVVLSGKYVYQTYITHTTTSSSSSSSRLGEYHLTLSDTSSHHGDTTTHPTDTSSTNSSSSKKKRSSRFFHKSSRHTGNSNGNTGNSNGIGGYGNTGIGGTSTSGITGGGEEGEGDDEVEEGEGGGYATRKPKSLRGTAGEVLLSMLPRRMTTGNRHGNTGSGNGTTGIGNGTSGNGNGNSGTGIGYEMVPTTTTRNPFTIQHHDSDDDNDSEEGEEVEGVEEDEERGGGGSSGNRISSGGNGGRESRYSPHYYLKQREEDVMVKARLQRNIIQSATTTTSSTNNTANQ